MINVTGPIPSELGKLNKLSFLSFSFNYLTGVLIEHSDNVTDVVVVAKIVIS